MHDTMDNQNSPDRAELHAAHGSTLRFPPPEPRKFACPIGCTPTSGCPNMECTSETMHGERYRCDQCGESYFIDYDEIR